MTFHHPFRSSMRSAEQESSGKLSLASLAGCVQENADAGGTADRSYHPWQRARLYRTRQVMGMGRPRHQARNWWFTLAVARILSLP